MSIGTGTSAKCQRQYQTQTQSDCKHPCDANSAKDRNNRPSKRTTRMNERTGKTRLNSDDTPTSAATVTSSVHLNFLTLDVSIFTLSCSSNSSKYPLRRNAMLTPMMRDPAKWLSKVPSTQVVHRNRLRAISERWGWSWLCRARSLMVPGSPLFSSRT